MTQKIFWMHLEINQPFASVNIKFPGLINHDVSLIKSSNCIISSEPECRKLFIKQKQCKLQYQPAYFKGLEQNISKCIMTFFILFSVFNCNRYSEKKHTFKASEGLNIMCKGEILSPDM